MSIKACLGDIETPEEKYKHAQVNGHVQNFPIIIHHRSYTSGESSNWSSVHLAICLPRPISQ